MFRYVMLKNTFTDYCLVEEEILMNIKVSLYLIVIGYSEELSVWISSSWKEYQSSRNLKTALGGSWEGRVSGYKVNLMR